MNIETLVTDAISFTRQHSEWAPYITFLVAFSESMAFISLLVPGWGILIGIGAIVGVSGLDFIPIWIGASLGAAAGDWLSYSIGFRLKGRATQIWPLSRNPEMVAKGQDFCDHWGAWAVFIGRFFGPLRAVVPLLAGIFAMPSIKFQLANISSAFLWAFVLLAPGALALRQYL
ncbi:DedA family protein [Phyllobacterium sp. 628]|uniref:DedA family protein n=1 Tax=Phyllobacterium sp. 628 TaxID=2718938 RepID=UPI0016625563|nr:DedA family protein [Phyllobacterium sp. 628]QND52899.1 DedA family protein [Phyllobacterium sp. 628]